MIDKVVHSNVGPAWSVCTSSTLIDHVVKGCARNPERPLVEFEDGVTIGRQEFLELCEAFAAYLKPRVKPGDRVGLALSNRAEYFVALVAVVANRGIVVSINPESREHDAGHILSDAAPVLMIVEPSNRAAFEEALKEAKDVEIVCIDGDEPNGFARFAATGRMDLESADCERDDVTCIFYTSGTTGVPKGCMIDHEWWLRVVDVDIRMNPDGRDKALCTVPFYYADPTLYLMQLLQIGGTLVVMRRFSVSRYWEVVSRFGVTKIHAIASIPLLLLKRTPSPIERQHKVHHAICTAVPADLHHELVERFGFKWIDNYGATETGLISRIPIDAHDEMIGSGSLGVADPEVEIRIVDKGGKDVPEGEPGQALVKAPGMFRGYFKRPEATAETVRDGWYHTGDQVRRDERGFIYFLGREKDLIRRSGQNIAAAEVEAVLRLLPQVKDAAVIPIKDDLRGEEVKAYVLLVDGVLAADLPPQVIVNHCLDRLAAFKVPRFIEYRKGDFPRTASMRVNKMELKAEKQNLIEGCWDGNATLGSPR